MPKKKEIRDKFLTKREELKKISLEKIKNN